MGFLSLALTFIGYTLVYAATANHGRFAVSPWSGVIADAYTDAGSSDVPGSPTNPGTPPAPNAPGRSRKKKSDNGGGFTISPIEPIPGLPIGPPESIPGIGKIPKIHIPWPWDL